MAEIVGVVASSIALVEVAGKVGGRALALKRLWDEVQEVPETIACLMREIEILDPMLADMENELAPSADGRPTMDSWNDRSARLSLAYCRQATADLDDLLRDLSADLGAARRRKRGRAKLKVILEKETLRRFQDRLQTAVRLLSLAQQSYLVALTKLQPDIILGRISAVVTASQPRDDENNPKTSVDRTDETNEPPFAVARPRNKEPGWKPLKPLTGSPIFGDISWNATSSEGPFRDVSSDWHIRIRLPFWLGQKAWDVRLSNAIGSWKFNIKPYFIRTYDSPVFEYARAGNTKAIYDLLVKEEASIYDCTPEGLTLLHLACITRSPNAIRELISWGLDMTASTAENSYLMTPLDCCLSTVGRIDVGETAHDIDNILLSYNAYDNISVDIPQTERSLTCEAFHSVASFKVFQPRIMPNYYQLSRRDRLKWIDPTWLLGGPGVLFHAIAQDGNWHVSDLEELQKQDICFLNIFAILYGIYQHRQVEQWNEMRFCARKVIAATSNVNFLQNQNRWPIGWAQRWSPRIGLSNTSVTPLLIVLHEFNIMWLGYQLWPLVDIHGFKRQADVRIRAWLEDLSACGINLESYGRTEHEMLSNNTKQRKIWYPNTSNQWVRLSGFDYGVTPEDWVFHWDIVPEDYVGNFWHLVDNPPLHIPGEWVEDSEYAWWWQEKRYNSSDEESDSEQDSESPDGSEAKSKLE